MTLKEKFEEKAFCMCEDMTQIDNYADIADEFAIGFANWVNKVSYRTFDGNWYLTQIDEDIKKTTEELLEIYKKEKGL